MGEIEHNIREYPGITDCIVLAKKYSDSVILIVAYLVCKSSIEFEGLKQHLGKHLPDYMIPNHFQKVDNIPLASNGKADRNGLPEPIIQVRS
jgi:surfactin family lipopeptide synthetase A/lichenysin synthetase A